VIHSVALTQILNVGTVTAHKLIAHFGEAEEVFRASKKDLLKVHGVGDEIANSIVKQEVLDLAEKEVYFCETHGIEILLQHNPLYPQRLKNYPDAPFILYYKGSADLNASRTVGIVGTRNPSAVGRENCQQLVKDLKQYNSTIISGLALGIDITAHRQSLELGIPTIGVMGTGMAKIYPREHKQTATEMLEMGGLLTEFSSNSGPDAKHFPMRNRIIAALSDALVVVESATKGGSIITANLAFGYNKDVFTFPGRIADKNSQGCNMLIKSNKAALIEKAGDLAYGMNWDDTPNTQSRNHIQLIQPQLFPDLSPHEQKVLDLLRANGQTGIDLLTHQTGFTPAQVSSLLLNLEFKGAVTSLRGKQYAANN
jgi:DNA processing protein